VSALAHNKPIPMKRTMRAPVRSTTIPAKAWPIALMVKNTLMRNPTCVKLSPMSGISQGNNGGNSKWKKCETA